MPFATAGMRAVTKALEVGECRCRAKEQEDSNERAKPAAGVAWHMLLLPSGLLPELGASRRRYTRRLECEFRFR